MKAVVVEKREKALPETKGERTRRRLMDSALTLLARDGYHDLKTTDVSRTAGVATGVFYSYFKDKNELVLELLGEMFERNAAQIFEGKRSDDAFEAVLEANRRYVTLVAAGGGLNRAVVQIIDALPEARLRWQALNLRIARRIGSGMAARSASGGKGVDLVFAALALQSMLDNVLLQAFAYRDPAYAEFARDPERLAHQLSILWFRAAYGRDPGGVK